MENTIINLAIAGVGYWGPNLVRNFIALKSVNLKVICDVREERLEAIKKVYPSVNTTTEVQEIISNPEIDGIVLALPAGVHYLYGKEALQSNKHVFVEKPMAMSVSEAEEMIGLSDERGKVLMVGHTFEYNPAVRAIKEYIDSSELGEIYYIFSQRLNLGRVRNDVNAMWNFAPHDISIILYWLGKEPIKVSAHGLSHIQEGIEDVVFLNLDFENGISAHIHSSWLHPKKVRLITIVGSKKMIIYDDTSSDAKIQIYDKGIDKRNIGDNLGSYDDFGKFQLILRAGDVLIPKIRFSEPLQIECSHFIDCIIKNKRPQTDGENGLRVVRILENAEKSLKGDGESVFI